LIYRKSGLICRKADLLCDFPSLIYHKSSLLGRFATLLGGKAEVENHKSDQQNDRSEVKNRQKHQFPPNSDKHCSKSDRRPPQSKTLARETKRPANAQCLGVRWQSGSGDTAFERMQTQRESHPFRAGESGVALCFPPQSKTLARGTKRPANAQCLGVRWQSGSDDTAFEQMQAQRKSHPARAGESGVALRFPPHSKTLARGTKRPANTQRLGVRWQSGSGDTAFEQMQAQRKSHPARAGESGVALCFPPQSKTH